MGAPITPETIGRVARAICAEKCAFYGYPPCHQTSDEWPNPYCDEPGCHALAVAAISAIRAAQGDAP